MQRTDLKPGYIFRSEAAAYLNTTERKLGLFQKYGLLKAGKLGKNFCYKIAWLDSFMETWAGYDLGTEEKIKAAISEKTWRDKHERR